MSMLKNLFSNNEEKAVDFYKAVEGRRSIYALDKNVKVSDERIMEVINHSVMHTPTAFNSQTGRVVVVMGEKQNKLWDITMEALRKVVPAEAFGDTEAKINSFKAAYGTVLFYEDQKVVKGLQEQFALYKDNFPVWSQQGSGILQNMVWTALHIEGLGASLQHYNELIEADVRKAFDIPEDWKMIGQMPFGNIVAPAGEKEFAPLAGRVRVLK